MIERVTLKMQTYNYLKERIISGEIKPGELYTEQGFAQALNISRTPVREAVLQLAHEDFVTIRPNKGFVVREYTPEEIEQYLQVRTAIEGFCGMYAADMAGSDKWEKLIKELEGYLSDEYKMTTSAASPKDFMENDTKFHMAIVSFSGNEQMLKIMTDMRSRIDRVGVKSLGMDGRMYNTYREHKELVKAIKGGNRAEVYKAIEFHFDTCRALMSGGK